jgi:uncharacterized protein (TIGR02271 family)
MYDTRAEAEAARDRLTSQFDVEGRAKIIDQSSTSSGQGSSDLDNIAMPHEDRHAYGEGLRRGGFMLCAEVDEDEDADRVVSVLEQTSSVDLDERQDSWRNEGWTGYQGASASAGMAGQSAMDSGAMTGGRDNLVQEERIPIVEEQLRVGKREVNRGGARVRSYVEEVPVDESISLREEHVDIERRPVDQPLASADLDKGALFQDRTIELTETAEEAVVGKEARVVEEVVVSKSATEHTEQVHDTVRRTHVDVDEGLTGTDRTRADGDRSSFGFDDKR